MYDIQMKNVFEVDIYLSYLCKEGWGYGSITKTYIEDLSKPSQQPLFSL